MNDGLRKTLKPENIVALVDSREQVPLDIAPLRTEPGILQTGDYALKALPNAIRIERKSLSDLVGCIGRDRERFEREIERLMAFPVRILLIESTWAAIELGKWRGKVKPNAVIGSLLGWQAAGISIHMAHDHKRAGVHDGRMLFTVARRRWRELNAMHVEQADKSSNKN